MLSPDHLMTAAAALFSCVSFSLLFLGGKVSIVGAVLSVITVTALVLINSINVSAVKDGEFFASYVGTLLFEKGYGFAEALIGDASLSSREAFVAMLSETGFAAFSTRISVFMAMLFAFIIAYCIMGKKLRIVMFSLFIASYMAFSFFTGFFPKANAFALFVCAIASVYFMLVYEHSGSSLSSENIKEPREHAAFAKVDPSIWKAALFFTFSFSLSCFIGSLLSLDTNMFVFLPLCLASCGAVLCLYAGFFSKGLIKDRRLKNAARIGGIVLILALASLDVFVFDVLYDVPSDVRYCIGTLYYRAAGIPVTESTTRTAGVLSLIKPHQIYLYRSSSGFAAMSLRISAFIRALCVVLSAAAVLRERFGYILTAFTAVSALAAAFFLGFDAGAVFAVVFLLGAIASYIIFLPGELKAKKKEKAALSESRKQNKRASGKLGFYDHAKQGFAGVVCLVMTTVMAFVVFDPSSLSAMPEISAIENTMYEIRVAINSHIKSESAANAQLVSADFGGGMVSDERITYNDVLKMYVLTDESGPLYLRGWVGKEYEDGVWSGASAVDIMRFRQEFKDVFPADMLYKEFADEFSPDVFYLNYASVASMMSRYDPKALGLSRKTNAAVRYAVDGSRLLLLPSYSVFGMTSLVSLVSENGGKASFSSIGDSVFRVSVAGNPGDLQFSVSAVVPDYSHPDFLETTKKAIKDYNRITDLLLENDFFDVREYAEMYELFGEKYNPKTSGYYDALIKSRTVAEAERKYRDYVYREYTGLSAKIRKSDRMRELYEQITEKAPDRLDKIFAVARYLQRNYIYTVAPPKSDPGIGDYIEGFLFDTKRGYCTHFATAMVNLLRVGGIPARYVEGYHVDSGTQVERVRPGGKYSYVYSVYDKEAHAWVEAYIDGVGWMMFECTAGYGGNAASSEQGSVSPPNTDDPPVSGTDDPPSTMEITGPETGEISPPVTPGKIPGAGEKDVPAALVAAAAVATAVILAALVLALRVRIVRALRRRKFMQSGKRGAHEMMTYLAQIIIYCGKEYSFESADDIAESVRRNVSRFTDAGRIEYVVDTLRKSEFSDFELEKRQRKEICSYLLDLSDRIYSGSGLFGKIYGRYILCRI